MLRLDFLKTLTLSGLTCLIPEIEKYQTDIVDTILVDMTDKKISNKLIGNFVGFKQVRTPKLLGVERPPIRGGESVEELLKQFEIQSEWSYTLDMIEGDKYTFNTRNAMNNFLWEKIQKSNLGPIGCNIIGTQNRFMVMNRFGNTGWILNPLHEDIQHVPGVRPFIRPATELSSTDVVCYYKYNHYRSPGWYMKKDDSYILWMAPDYLKYLGRFTKTV